MHVSKGSMRLWFVHVPVSTIFVHFHSFVHEQSLKIGNFGVLWRDFCLVRKPILDILLLGVDT